MKKLTTLFLSVMSMALVAQIPNPSFESWTSGAPNGWTIYSFYAAGSVTESNTAHAGSHSVSLNAVLVSSTYYGGFVQTGASLGDDYFANAGNPKAINGWYQMTTSGGDAFYYTATAKNAGGAIGAGSGNTGVATAVWKQFSICINYSAGTADSLSIQLELANVSSGQPHAGSFILVDDLSFGTCLTGIDEIGNDVKIEAAYPNPASTICNIIYSIPTDAKVNINLYDISGRKVATLLDDTEQTPGRYKVPVDVSNLANGIYIYRVTVNGQSYAQKLTVAK
jgi:hypothetical protein